MRIHDWCPVEYSCGCRVLVPMEKPPRYCHEHGKPGDDMIVPTDPVRASPSAADLPQEDLQQLGRLIDKAALNVTSPADDAIIDALIEIRHLLRAALASRSSDATKGL